MILSRIDAYTMPNPDSAKWRNPVINWSKIRQDACSSLEYAYPDDAENLKAQIASWQDGQGDIRLIMIRDYLIAMAAKYPGDKRKAGKAVRAYIEWVQLDPSKRDPNAFIF